jgi:DNA excision repair protein ERCC-2
MLQVDLDSRRIVASVRALIEQPPDTPRPAGWITLARSALGMDAHRQYRREREREVEGFRGEVPVSMSHEVDGFEVLLRGRMDGLIDAGDGRLIVEEVKSVADPAREARPEHLLQLRLYLLCLARADPSVPLVGRLLLTSAVDVEHRREIAVDCSLGRTARDLDRLLRDRIRAARAAAERARMRAGIARGLSFPHKRQRRGQRELIDVIQRALGEGRPILAAAPTGVGKTIGALWPALRFALSQDATLFFATSRNTQQRLVAKTFLDLASGAGEGLRALTLRAKARMCPPRTLLCHPDHCIHLERFLDKSRRDRALRSLLQAGAHISPDEILKAGIEETLCPYALSIALCREVDLVIGDYNYVYGPAPLGLFDEEDAGRPAVVVLDEAHSLFDRARAYHSPFLERSCVRRLGLEEHPVGIRDYLRELEDFIDRSIDAAREESVCSLEGRIPLPVDTSRWNELADRALRLTIRWALHKQERGIVRPEDPLLDTLWTVVQIRNLITGGEPEMVPFAARGGGAGLGILCVNPARKLEERHRCMLGTIAMSATLSPIPHHREVLGFARLDPVEVTCPSPFPRSRLQAVIVPSVRTAYRFRSRNFVQIAGMISRVAGVHPGHYVAYFPSFEFLQAVRPHLPAEGLLVQEPRLDEPSRRSLLDRLRTDCRPLLLLAVMGGIFAEGIDLPGESLVGAIVVSPGLPRIGFERDAMRRYFEAATGRGFAHAMLFPGMQRVIQAAGRVHRSSRDRGVIVLIGERFATRPYRDCLPPHWYRKEPGELVADDPVPLLETFWRRWPETSRGHAPRVIFREP